MVKTQATHKINEGAHITRKDVSIDFVVRSIIGLKESETVKIEIRHRCGDNALRLYFPPLESNSKKYFITNGVKVKINEIDSESQSVDLAYYLGRGFDISIQEYEPGFYSEH